MGVGKVGHSLKQVYIVNEIDIIPHEYMHSSLLVCDNTTL